MLPMFPSALAQEKAGNTSYNLFLVLSKRNHQKSV